MPPRRLSPQPPIDDTSSTPLCMRIDKNGVVLDISVSPNAKRTEVAGLHDGALRVRLASQPIDGQANAALLRWLADALDQPRQSVELIRGDTSRRKQVRVQQSPELVSAWLHQILGTTHPM